MFEPSLTPFFIQQALAAGGDVCPLVEIEPFTGVETDSREVQLGSLFVCLRGERFDGHDFAQEVVSAGARALVVERLLAVDCPQYVVKDTRIAFGALAAAWRKAFDVKVLAVVGSNGKTTTKEMLASICRAHVGAEHVLVTAGNLNNDLGVPRTLLGLTPAHRLAVIEMGMNHPREIEYLAQLVRPDVVLLTNAQREHQEFMKTVDAVARENGSAFAYLNEGGAAVFPAGTPFDALWLDLAGPAACARFGDGGDCHLESLVGEEAVLRSPFGSVAIRPAFLGKHNAMNASGAALAALIAGCSLNAVQLGLEQFHPVPGRLERVFQSSRLLLINDAYNANPDSVNAASQVLSSCSGQTLLVLGDMGEVGDLSDQFHAEVGQYAKACGVGRLFCLGDATVHAVEAFGVGALHFQQIDDLLEQVMQITQEGPWTVLVKGSRFMKMERVVTSLIEHFSVLKGK